MVTRALNRLDTRLAQAGERSLSEQLAPGRAASELSHELKSLGLAPARDLVAWFSAHDGGWLEPAKLQLLSFDQAVEHRMELSTDLLVPFRSSWFPFRTDSTESYLVDVSTGAVMHYDLETGDDQARQLAPSLAAWINSVAKGPGARFGVSVGKEWNKQWSASDSDELREGAERALRGLAGFARRAADWIDDKSADLVAKQSDSAAQESHRATPNDETITKPSNEGAGPSESRDTAVAPGSARVAIEAPATTWTPDRGKVDRFGVAADGRIVATAAHPEGTDLYVLDPAQDLVGELIAEIPERLGFGGFALSPTTAQVLINGAWLYDLESMSGGRVEALVDQPFRVNNLSATWASDGGSVLVCKPEHQEYKEVPRDAPHQSTTHGPWSYLLDIETLTVRKLMGEPSLVGHYLLWTATETGEVGIRVEGLDGRLVLDADSDEACDLSAYKEYGLVGRSAFLSEGGSKMVVPSFVYSGFVLLDLAAGTSYNFPGVRPRGITADGSSILAVRSNHDMASCVMVNTGDYGIEQVGLPEGQSGFDWSADGTRLVHHAVTPDERRAIEYIDWTLGLSSLLPMSSTDEQFTILVKFCGDAVVFHDRRPSGEETVFVSHIVGGQLGTAIDIGGDAIQGSLVKVSKDGQRIAWKTVQGISWCSPDGGQLYALLVGPHPKRRNREWLVTDANQVVVNMDTQLVMASMAAAPQI